MSSSPPNACADLAEDARQVVVRADVAFGDECRIDRALRDRERSSRCARPDTVNASVAPPSARVCAIAQAIERLFATPMTSARLPAKEPAIRAILSRRAKSSATLRSLAPCDPVSRLLRGARRRAACRGATPPGTANLRRPLAAARPGRCPAGAAGFRARTRDRAPLAAAARAVRRAWAVGRGRAAPAQRHERRLARLSAAHRRRAGAGDGAAAPRDSRGPGRPTLPGRARRPDGRRCRPRSCRRSYACARSPPSTRASRTRSPSTARRR